MVRKYEEWTQEELEHYIRVHKAHEDMRLNTNDRNDYWKKYKTEARWEHG